MQVKQVLSEALKREYNIIVPANDISAKVDEKLKEISKTLKMPGFRPGKVPMDIVKKNHGKNVMGEVLEKIVTESSRDALDKEGLRPAMQPKIEIVKFDDGVDLEYKMEFEILPDVPEVKFENIEVEKFIPKVSDADVDEALGKLAKESKSFAKVDRVAKNGDSVVLDFKGFVDGEAFAGGEAKNHELELGSNSFIEGFEEQLVGLKSGDNKDVNVTFPTEYHSKDLAGKPAKFEVTIHEVKEPAEAKIDAEFAKKFGFEELEKFKEAVKGQIKNEASGVCRSFAKKDLFDKLDKACAFDIPEEMSKMEFDSIWKQIEDAKKANPDDKDFKGKSDDDLKKEYQEMANRRVRLGIILAEIGAKNKIQVTQDELNAAVMAEARRYPGSEQQVVDYYIKNPQNIEALKGPVLEEKVVDFLLEKVNVKEKETSLEELKKLSGE